MKFNLHIIDVITIVFYFVIILLIGFLIRGKNNRKKSDKEEFLLAGRNLTLPFFTASLVATWYGNILGVGEFIYNSGVVGWVCFGLTYYITAAFYGFFIAKKVRKLNVFSIPEQISINYGKPAGIVSSVVVLLITIPAPYILILGLLINMIFGFSLIISIIMGTIISMIFLFWGGFRSDVYTNSIQFLLMYTGFGLFVFYILSDAGWSLSFLNSLPESHLTFRGNLSWQYILAWLLIACQTFIDPSFHQRCSAVDKPATAQIGIFASIALWVVFDSMTLFAALYAKYKFVDISPVLAYPILAESILPVFVKGIFITAMLATVMSTLDSYAFISGVTFGNDLAGIFLKKIKNSITLTRFGLLVIMIIGIIMAILIPSPVDLVFRTASIAIPGLILPLILTFGKKKLIIGLQSVYIMVLSSVFSIIWMIGRDNSWNSLFVQVEPMVAGMIGSIVITLIVFIINRKRI